MTLIGRIHDRHVHNPRVRVLVDHLCKLIPSGSVVLDVGCGDGLLSQLVIASRPDLDVMGIDVLVRPECRIPVTQFDGERIPFPDRSVDVVIFVDVLHHTTDPINLLEEAKRVSRKAIIIKDHRLNGFLAQTTLRFMDWTANSRYGVSLPYNYLREQEWIAAFAALNLRLKDWDQKIRLYPPLINIVFGRSLHFIARLEVSS